MRSDTQARHDGAHIRTEIYQRTSESAAYEIWEVATLNVEPRLSQYCKITPPLTADMREVMRTGLLHVALDRIAEGRAKLL